MAVNNRIGNRKTRSGCLSCKRRRVKCDEAKPSCLKCSNLGIKCDGYALFAPARPTQQIVITASGSNKRPSARLLSPFKATQQEWQAYDYYFHKASPSIGGALDLEFWYNTVLQLGQDHESIRFAIFALGNLARHASECGGIPDTSCNCQHYRSAIKQYNKAILSLDGWQQNDPRQTMSLVTCILFTCMESILGNPENAVSLVQHGYSMSVQDPQATIKRGTQFEPIKPLTTIFDRLRLLSSLFGRPLSNPNQRRSVPIAIPKQFQSTTEARDLLYSIMNDAIDFLRSVSLPRWLHGEPPEHLNAWEQIKQGLSHRLDQWYRAFLLFPGVQDDEQSSLSPDKHKISETLALLEVYCTLARVWLATSLSVTELSYENHLEDFKIIVKRAGGCLLKDSNPSNSRFPFSFEMGWIPPLYFTAIKCRDPLVRRQALILLHLAPFREGTWDRGEMIAVVKKVIELEEGEWKDLLFCNVDIGSRYWDGHQPKTEIRCVSRLEDPALRWALRLEILDIDDSASIPDNVLQSIRVGQ